MESRAILEGLFVFDRIYQSEGMYRLHWARSEVSWYRGNSGGSVRLPRELGSIGLIIIIFSTPKRWKVLP